MTSFEPKMEALIGSLYEDLIGSCAAITDSKGKELLDLAFKHVLGSQAYTEYDEAWFQIKHCVQIARITADELNLDLTSILAALLHDTSFSVETEIQGFCQKFGKDTYLLIEKLQQIDKIRMDKISIMPESFIQLLLSISHDVRVILIKLADRISLMRTIDQLPVIRQKQLAAETSALYSPIAHRLGLYKIKSELDDLAMQFTLPEVYKSISKKIKDTANEQRKYFEDFISPIRKSLEAAGMDFEIKARTKAIPSIYSKMKKQEIDFDEVFDFFAIRIITNSLAENEKADCWKAYSHVTDIYPPNTSRLRDWISVPRPNGYESLHVTVEAPGKKWVEVQIRTKRMDENAEKGMAAHWRYKEQKGGKPGGDEWLNKIRAILENYTPGEEELSQSSDLKILSDYIYVFTPEGHLKKLRTGATVLDFAFEVHTEIGQHCTGAKVNNLFATLKHVLKTGDKVEIVTSKNQKPNIDWLNWATTNRALTKIRRILKDVEFSQAETGKDILMRKLNQMKIDYNDEVGNRLILFYKAGSGLDLFHGIAEGKYDIQKLKEALQPPAKIEEPRPLIKPLLKSESSIRKKPGQSPIVIINDETPLADVKFARCCQPVYGDEIFGFVTVADGIKIHRSSCTNAPQMFERYHYRVISARWAESTEFTSYVATIRIAGTDQVGILNDITATVSGELKANIRSINLNSRNGKFDGTIMVNVENKSHLNLIIARLLKMKGIRKVLREN